jgi:MFS family permease
MRHAILTLSSLLLGFFLLQMSNGLQGTLLAVRADLEGFGATLTGLVMSGFFAGMCLGSFLAGRLIQRAGHVRTFAALASVASAASLVHLVFVDPIVWIGVRSLTGFCFAGLIVTVESWLNASVASAQRGRLLSIYAMVGMAAGVTGQLLFNLADPGGYELFVLVSIGLSLALVPSALSQARAPVAEVEQDPPSIRGLWRLSPFGTVAMLMAGATIGAFFGLVPVFAQRIGFGQSEIAVLMAAGTAGGFALQFPLGWLSDRVERRAVCIGLAIVAVALLLFVPRLSVLPLWPSVGVAFVIGGVLLPTTSLVVAHVNDRAPPRLLLAASGGLVLMQGLGAAAGPLVAGAAMEVLGPAGLLYTLAAVQSVIAAFAVARIVANRGVRRAEKGAFAPIPLDPVDGELEAYPEAPGQSALAGRA